MFFARCLPIVVFVEMGGYKSVWNCRVRSTFFTCRIIGYVKTALNHRDVFNFQPKGKRADRKSRRFYNCSFGRALCCDFVINLFFGATLSIFEIVFASSNCHRFKLKQKKIPCKVNTLKSDFEKEKLDFKGFSSQELTFNARPDPLPPLPAYITQRAAWKARECCFHCVLRHFTQFLKKFFLFDHCLSDCSLIRDDA